MKATCVICSDILDGENTNVTTPCGHVFHEICVLQWLEYKSSCPACRQNINKHKLVKLFFTISSEETQNSADHLENELSNVKALIRSKDMQIKKLQDRASELKCFVVKAEEERDDHKKQNLEYMGEITSLRIQLKQSLKNNSYYKKTATENQTLQNQLLLLKNVGAIIDGRESDINEILNSYGEGQQSLSHMATYIIMLKKQLQTSRVENSSLHKEVKEFRRNIGYLNAQVHEKNREVESLSSDVKRLNECLEQMEGSNRPKDGKRSSDRFNTPTTLSHSLLENTPTPCKRPKINMVNAFVSKIKKQDEYEEDSLLVNLGKNILQNKQLDNLDNDDSTIRQGYDGLGGHSKHIFRSTSVKIKLGKKTIL